MRIPFRARLIRAGRAATPSILSFVERLHAEHRVFMTRYRVNPRARWGWDGEPVHPELASLLERGDDRYASLLGDLRGLDEWASQIPLQAPEGETAWDMPYWGGLDALVQCWLLRDRAPATYLEVGSGYSTLFARRAITDFRLSTRLISIDPHPRVAVNDLCDVIIRRPFEDVAEAALREIKSGDVVLFDGSHLAIMNSDAVVMTMELLPRLPASVVVGIDDVFLPWDYHPTWADRFYGEQYVVGAFLLGGGGGWEVLFPGFYVTQSLRHADLLEPLWKLVETHFGRTASTMWLTRRRRVSEL